MKSVMIATANTDHMLWLTDLLQNRGYFVIPAGDADLALTFLAHGGIVIDAVIADHEQDGFWTILNAVKSRGPVPPPVVAVSERASVSDYLDALSAGAFEFFIWPIRSAEFVRIVDSAARKNIVQPRDTGGGLLFMPEPSTGRVGSSF